MMKRIRLTRLTIAAAAILSLAACSEKAIDIYDYAKNSFVTETITGPLHVFLIGLDGWGSYSLPRADMPTIKRMMAGGAYSLTARAVMPSISSPNWASMFYGSAPALHGYTQNTVKPTFDPVVIDEYGYYPNIFTLLRKIRPAIYIAALYEWGGIADLYPASVVNFNRGIPDLSSNHGSLSVITNYITSISSRDLTFTFIHFDGADHAGHAEGHNTPAYYDMLARLDSYIGEIEQKVIDEGMMDATVFILSADHGGINKSHGGNTTEERQIPFIIYGKNIAPGTVISGDINIYDIAPTICALFGISPPPVWLGRSVLHY
ncbi:MAG: alkaline phosphatase [Treponema sp.]|jgi:predicted AlkP superfamily pyrophosphatase or phosphodiesterase|nr:alkaline phosphatase [Treponema sp.]